MREYPQTFEQEALWIADQFMGDPSPFLETWAQHIVGPLDVPALERALASLVERHAVFRTGFTLGEQGAVQCVDPAGAVPLERLPWPGGELHETLRRAGQRPLDLTVSPARLTLYDLAPDEYVLLLQIHHVAVDDASLVLLDQELSALYAEETGGGPAGLAPPGLSLGEHAVRARAAGIAPDDLAFWAAFLDGAPVLTHLPPRPRPLAARRGSACECVRATVPAALGDAVRTAARALRTTPHVLMSTCMAVTAAAVNGADVVIGSPVSRRGEPDLDTVFGCLTDLLPVRYLVPATATFGEVCTAAKRRSLDVLRHRNVPYARIGGGVTRKRGVLSGEHLGRICLVLDQSPSRLDLPGLRCERVHVGGASAKFDWLQYVVADGSGWDVRADYATDYFTEDEAALMLRQWLTALTTAADDPGVPVRELFDRLAALA
ncbi:MULTISPECIES: condensation domain-containing protein [unclassified Streptomyces]|uniref:condensation domain-containing protein n=1 Tax=unclassified Streptomyces TaxID=2593676 RepID=UPI002259B8E3|nr:MULTISPECIES: condensation domain-containing protein [unclassified Streptomyces]MCX5144118.1 condensation domain-containing protein [Streptomyces sp. NBC_00338]WRZ68495.1 condensation domain-containing protein [Streptomyces sp. NBC_01257]WSU62453.1 condensation domain-containing protein [Streptomyces sp. NBC_01104]